MKAARVYFSPFVLGRRSKTILLWYAVAAAGLTDLAWWRMEQLMAASGVPLPVLLSRGGVVAKFFCSPWTRALVVAMSSFLAAGLTVVALAGPIHRIETWLTEWEIGLEARPLRVRAGDAFETLIRLLNEYRWREITSRLPAPRKRSRPTDERTAKPSGRRAG